jgi:hypothetical protein
MYITNVYEEKERDLQRLVTIGIIPFQVVIV